MWERRRGSLLEASDQKGLQPIGRIIDFNDLMGGEGWILDPLPPGYWGEEFRASRWSSHGQGRALPKGKRQASGGQISSHTCRFLSKIPPTEADLGREQSGRCAQENAVRPGDSRRPERRESGNGAARVPAGPRARSPARQAASWIRNLERRASGGTGHGNWQAAFRLPAVRVSGAHGQARALLPDGSRAG